MILLLPMMHPFLNWVSIKQLKMHLTCAMRALHIPAAPKRRLASAAAAALSRNSTTLAVSLLKYGVETNHWVMHAVAAKQCAV